MCCLFGMMDYGGHFSYRQKNQVLRALARASEARGTDASGYAYCAGGQLQVYKRPLPGHKLKFKVPETSRAVMGHTRLTTQGSERKNRNNHPFLGKPTQVVLDWGEILQIDSNGNQLRGEFDPQNLRIYPHSPCSFMLDPPYSGWHFPKRTSTQREYIRILKSIASFYGYTLELVDSMLDGGFSTDEIEEMIYYGRV